MNRAQRIFILTAAVALGGCASANEYIAGLSARLVPAEEFSNAVH